MTVNDITSYNLSMYLVETLYDVWLLFRSFNPILTGGGVNLTPPVRNPRLPRDRRRSRHAFSGVFSFRSSASFDTKFAKIGPSVARSHDVLYSHVGTKFAQNLHFAYVCVQNTWKLLIFLKCSKNSVYSVFLAICTISYILKLIKIKLQKIKNHKNNEIHKK